MYNNFFQLKRRIDISERLYREQRRVYLESLDLADAWKQKPKSKNKSVTVESVRIFNSLCFPFFLNIIVVWKVH